MATSKTLPWTVSKGGRRVVRAVGASVVAGTFLAHYLPHTWLIEKTREVTQAYRRGRPIPVPPSVTQLVEEVMGDMGMGQEVKGRVRVYTSYGFDVFHAGNTHSPHGAILGVPASLRWVSADDFDGSGVVVNNTPVPWGTPAGSRLRDSLILTRDAKKFIIARELHALTSDPILTRSLVPPLALMVSSSIAIGVNKRLNLYRGPRSLRVCLYCLAGLFGFGVYILGVDMGTVKSEAVGDEGAAVMGPRYADGGVEYYRKVLERNVALRELMGSDGEGLYTAMGNEEVTVRTKHLPITMRLDYMKNQVQKYSDGASDGKGEEK